jgi:hypothetical protein
LVVDNHYLPVRPGPILEYLLRGTIDTQSREELGPGERSLLSKRESPFSEKAK